ncbi:biotin--protein ligase [Chryseobacterium sp. Leaf404]|uniref:biotin--[acetyl-CoA-carboxylase] ligase n=1 Tax=unclassified Chryseobacterium TaxID=2593645 RepID=UPI0006FC9E33|nr:MULTISPECIES: biotin--[acetyl-CoA-carboxylase] ligase [unclassified Chryseobacterium]KQT22070.1 biotin--protein ligase [Chryseobacterium sp. Leaf404]
MDDLFYLKQCSSTNDELAPFILYPESNFIAVHTFDQTAGRGQYGNSWKVVANKNLAYSLAVKVTSVKVSDFLFNYYTAVTVRGFIAKLTDKEVKIKWPNDIIVDYKKVCGILIEKRKFNQQQYFVLGIGINVLQESFNEISNAGSLLSQTSLFFELEEFAGEFHKFMVSDLKNMPSEGEILDVFNRNLFRKDQISVFERNGTRQNGIIRSASQSGEIHIEFEDGIRKFYHKEIKLLY